MMNKKYFLTGLTGISLALFGVTPSIAQAAEKGYWDPFPQSKLEAISASSTDESNPNSTLSSALDGNPNTIWHSKWQGGATPAPHTLIFGVKNGVAENIQRIALGVRKSSSGSGRVKDYSVSVNRDQNTDCHQDPGQIAWKDEKTGSTAANFHDDTVIDIPKGAVKCIKVVYKKAWNGSNQPDNASSLAEFNLMVFKPGSRPLGPVPGPTALKNRPMPAGTIPSSQILNSLAYGDARADNADKTPIALAIPGPDGKKRIIGATPDPKAKPVADLQAATKNYFVDCKATGSSNEGTQQNPWTSLAEVNEHGDFQPAEQILFKRGTECRGLMHPRGSGSAGKEIVIDAYGDPSQPLPIITGGGEIEEAGNDLPNSQNGPESAVVRFFNQQYWKVRNLEITNYTGLSDDWNTRRRGVVVGLEDFGRGGHFEISHLYIHDVLGKNKKDIGGSGGIQFETWAGPQQKATSMEGLHVHHNVINHVSRSGINEGSRFRTRNSVGGSINDRPFAVWGPMKVHDNILSDIAGDAIVTQFASYSKVYNNTVWNYANHHGGKAASGNNAGLWPWDADHVHYYNNHVFDAVMPDGTQDSTAFDADYGTTGTLFEYNVSHDNAGGFMLFCGCGGLSTKTVMRYNISLNDGRGAENHAQGPRTFFIAGQADGEVYNNTFLLYPNVTVDKGESASSAVTYVNNLLLGQGPVKNTWNNNLALTSPWRNNLFTGTENGWPSKDTNIVEAGVQPANANGLDVLKVDPALVAGKGLRIYKDNPFITPKSSFEDITGRLIPPSNQPDLGAIQGKSLAAKPHLVNGGFEEKTPAGNWTLSNGAAVEKQEHKGGKFSLKLDSKQAQATQKVPVAVNGTYRLIAMVKPGAGGKLPTVTISNPNGNSVQAETPGPGTSRIADWVPVTALMRTAWDAKDLTVTITGPGHVDDVALELETDYMVDGSFQSTANTPWTSWNTGRTKDDSVSSGRSLKITGAGSSENPETVVPEANVQYQLTGWVKMDAGTSGVRLGAKEMNSAATPEQPAKEHVEFTADDAGKFVQRHLLIKPANQRFKTYCYLPQQGGHALCDDIMLTRAWDRSVPEIPAEKVRHTVSVTGGSAGVATEFAGEEVTITANPPEGKEFVNWESTPKLDFKDATKASTAFTMPDQDVTITAVYKDKKVAPSESPSENPSENQNGKPGTESAKPGQEQPKQNTPKTALATTGASTSPLLAGLLLTLAGSLVVALRRRRSQ